MESLLELITGFMWWLVDFFEQLHLYNQIFLGVITLVLFPVLWNLLVGKDSRPYFPQSLWWKVCVGTPLSVVFPLGLVVYFTQTSSKTHGRGGFFLSLLQLGFWIATMVIGLMLTRNADLLFWLFILSGSWYVYIMMSPNLENTHPGWGVLFVSFLILVVWVWGVSFGRRLTHNDTLQFLLFVGSGVVCWMAIAFTFSGMQSAPPVSELPLATPIDEDGNDIKFEGYQPASRNTLSTPQDAELADLAARFAELRKVEES